MLKYETYRHTEGQGDSNILKLKACFLLSSICLPTSGKCSVGVSMLQTDVSVPIEMLASCIRVMLTLVSDTPYRSDRQPRILVRSNNT